MKPLRSLLLISGGLLFLVAATGFAAEASFVGAKKCKMCHMKQYKSWETTKMAKVFDLLKAGARAEEKKAAGLDPAKDYTHDAECLPCHTTGYGKSGGFTSIEETPGLSGVQCESCHGPGSEYLKEGKMTLKNKEYKLADLTAAGLVIPGENTCTTNCHNTKSPFVGEDYKFNFEEKKAEGTHEHTPLKYQH